MVLKNLNLREGSDRMVKTRKILAVISVILMFVIFILIAIAWPRNVSMFDRVFGTSPVSKPMDMKLINYILTYLTPLLGATSIAGLFFNAMRHRRKYDHYSTALIIGVIISITGFILKALIN